MFSVKFGDTDAIYQFGGNLCERQEFLSELSKFNLKKSPFEGGSSDLIKWKKQ